MRLAMVLALPVTLWLSGCATTGEAGAETDSEQYHIQPHELLTNDIADLNMYDAVRILRPRWLQTRGGTDTFNRGRGTASVWMDGRAIGGLNIMKRYQVKDIREAKLLLPRETTFSRYRAPYGVILLFAIGGSGGE